MAPTAPKLLFGTAAIASFDPAIPGELLQLLKKHGVKDLDTAFIYNNSEITLAKLGVSKDFTIHTKAPGFKSGALSRQSVLDGAEESLKRLGVDKVETYYLHSPDPDTPLEETLSAIDEVYKAGKFKHFGLSNFKVEDVQRIYDIQSSKGGVLPTVFQGNYNPVSRHIETDLFPVLRKLKIAFYAYSPIAGGFLVKSPQALRDGKGDGRFDPKGRVGPLYNSLYVKDVLLEALDEWEAIAKDAGVSKAALAYRWVVWNSVLKAAEGDGVIIGASKTAQLEESLEAIENGPLDASIVARIDDLWKKVEKDAPLDNYNSFVAKA